jgi:hypothetical protein
VLDKLKSYLNSLPAGDVLDIPIVEAILAECWHEFSGNSDGGMEGYKLRHRMEAVGWNPPLLSFNLERHGGTVQGSSRAEIQAWTVDIKSGRAILHGSVGHRQLHRMSGPLKVEPIAKDIAAAILTGKHDARLHWKNRDKVRVLIGKIIPDDGPKQTVSGRRRRFWKALTEELVQSRWKPSAAQCFVRKSSSSD